MAFSKKGSYILSLVIYKFSKMKTIKFTTIRRNENKNVEVYTLWSISVYF